MENTLPEQVPEPQIVESPQPTTDVSNAFVPHRRGLNKKSILSACLVIFSLIAATSYFLAPRYFKVSPTPVPSPISSEQPNKIPSPSPQVQINTSNQLVSWLESPEKTANVGFFTLVDKYMPQTLPYCPDEGDCMGAENNFKYLKTLYEPKTTYYRIGKMNSLYPDADVYLAISRDLAADHVYKGVGFAKDFAYDTDYITLFIKTTEGKYIVTGDYYNKLVLCYNAVSDNCTFDKFVSQLPQISYKPDLLLDEAGTKTLYKDEKLNLNLSVQPTINFFDKSGLFLVKNFDNGYELYSNQNPQATVYQLKDFIKPKYFFKLPTGLAATVQDNTYSSIFYPDSSKKQDTGYAPLISWSTTPPQFYSAELMKKLSSYDPSETYSFEYSTNTDTCSQGIQVNADVVTNSFEKIDTTKDLVLVGSTDKGHLLYDFAQKNNSVLKQFWNQKIALGGYTDLLPYAEYLQTKPVILFKNTLGIYTLEFRQDLLASQCWGEPLIYLYPTKETAVSVKLSNKIKVTESQPLYQSGWNLIAHPDGKLTDKQKRSYPYLYWEGSAPILSQPVSKHVVEQEKIHDFFELELTQLGLTYKERSDFEKYWESKLQAEKYYLITFYSNEQVSQIAPLQITPTPDTMIRVMMTYKGFNSRPTNITEQNNSQAPLARSGFTAVEWGGVLH